MSHDESKKILVLAHAEAPLPPGVRIESDHATHIVSHSSEAIREWLTDKYGGFLICSGKANNVVAEYRQTVEQSLADVLPVGLALVDGRHVIMRANQQLKEWANVPNPVGADFFDIFNDPFIYDGDFCPFTTAKKTGQKVQSEMRDEDNRCYQLDISPYHPTRGAFHHYTPPSDSPALQQDGRQQNGQQDDDSAAFAVVVRDITDMDRIVKKFEALQKESVGLTDLTAEDVLSMSEEERVEFLKAKIIELTQNILHYDVIEIRRMSDGMQLEPLLAIGMAPEAEQRTLYAIPHGNGITGYVAATGKSYLCDDAGEDPFYLSGTLGGKSSITVPLMFHDQVIGTMNVESPETGAFTKEDLDFLELFSQNVAAALHTLDLLSAEKAGTAVASVEAIHRAVAMPIDQILNAAVRVIGRNPTLGTADPDMQLILDNARAVKSVILKVGESLHPIPAHPSMTASQHPSVRNKRILLIDEDETVATLANDLLLHYKCSVESTPRGEQALLMLQHTGYDAILSDIRLPDMSGFQLLLRLREFYNHDNVPLILIKGFGYDSDHVLVKARQAGHNNFLYKPFRTDQLLEALEAVIQ